MNGKLVTVLLLLDFSKAFDTVNSEILRDKLEKFFNFETCAANLIKSYLTDRRQFVCIKNDSSSFPIVISKDNCDIKSNRLFK